MLGVTLLSGCATTAPKANFAQGMALTSHMVVNHEVKTRVEAEGDLRILDIEKTRIAQRIEERIGAEKSKSRQWGKKKLRSGDHLDAI